MITANEVRIGNCVEFEFQSGWRQVAICANDFLHLSTPKYKGLYRGIPLTPERLEAAGWKVEHDVYARFAKDAIRRTAYTIEAGKLHFELECAGDVWKFTVAGVEVAEFQFFHQIQNAIFALTGEELTFTEPK